MPAIFDKTVNEIQPVGFDFEDDLNTGETISSVTSTVPAGLTAVGSATISSTSVYQVVSGGTVDTIYRVTLLATSSLGYKYEGKVLVRIIY